MVVSDDLNNENEEEKEKIEETIVEEEIEKITENKIEEKTEEEIEDKIDEPQIDTTENCNEEILIIEEETKKEIIETDEGKIVEEESEIIDEDITCHSPMIISDEDTDNEDVVNNADEDIEDIDNDKENFKSLTEKQYQLFPFDMPNTSSCDCENNEQEEEKQENCENEIVEEIVETEEKTETVEVDENLNLSEETSSEEINIIEEESQQENQLENNNDNEMIENIEDISEKEIEPEIVPKTVEIDFDESMGKLETALEIRYSSLKLIKFPIKVSNVIEGMSFPDELVLGNMNLKIGEEIVNNCYLKISSNESIKMLEIKNREFKLGISVSLNNDTINTYGSVRYYEISSLIKTSRITKVLELLERIFNGATITFKLNRLYGNISIVDRIESMRIKTLKNFFETMNKSGYKFQGDKLPESNNIYYLLELNSALLEKKDIETWCNFNFSNTDNKIDVNVGDSLIVKRIHKFNKNFSIEEKIIMKTPIDTNNIFKEKIAGYRKQCLIELKKI